MSTEARLAERVAALAELSDPGPGVTRLAFGERERDAHRMVAGWAQEDGARIETDGAGNTVVVYREGEPYLMLGSHLDSVASGGRYDGVVGVLAALEVAATAATDLELGLRAVVFSAEEGARYGVPCIGSAVASGQLGAEGLAQLHDAAGVSLLSAAGEVGLDPAASVPWAMEPALAGFLELHIEQGGSLEAEGVRLGVVDVVAGVARLEVTLTGRAEHSGTTPMSGRADALAGASELVTAVESIGSGRRDATATVGRLLVEPNGPTTIAGRARALVDIRDVDAGRQRVTSAAVRAAAETIAARRGLEVTVAEVAWRDPVILSTWMRQALANACVARRVPFRGLASGAGHDAAVVALRAPAAMLFVPTPGGRSHSPDERCDLADVALACPILHDALRTLDAQARAIPEDHR